MKRISMAGISLVLFGAVATAYGSGFGLYQPSAISHAMGGALVGKAMDASANFNNPATLTDLTNIQFTVGFVTEHPRGRVETSRNGGMYTKSIMDSGMFILPHFQLAVPLPADFTFGFGVEPDYGLGTSYNDSWPMNFSATETKIQSIVLNPNLAYKVTDDWSIGAGARIMYFEFEQYSRPAYNHPLLGQLGRFRTRLRGDNGMKGLGWQIGTKYDVTDTFSVGAVYKSWIQTHVDGKVSTDVISNPLALPQLEGAAAKNTGRAHADITMPQSIAAGCNWDVLPTWHLGAMVSWTQWSEYDTLRFELPPSGVDGDQYTPLKWRDTWRGSIGSCWDFAEDWKWMVSYTYDMDSTTSKQQSVMLPPADRHILGTGFVWNCWGGLELALSYACIFMDGGDMNVTEKSSGDRYHFKTKWGFCHAAGVSVTYRF